MTLAQVEALRPINGARDVASVAFQRAMSNGSISRRLGWAAVLLLPLTFPAQVPLVLLGSAQVMRIRRAASLQLGRTAHVRPAAVAAVLGFVLSICVYFTAVALVSGLPAWLVDLAFTAFIVVELAGAITASAIRRVWRAVRGRPGPVDVSTLDDAGGAPPTSITFVVAFPRAGKRGSELMAGIEAFLDDQRQTAELTARTTRLIAFYERHGFRSLDSDPRQMLRLPRQRFSPGLQPAASERTTEATADAIGPDEVTSPSSRL